MKNLNWWLIKIDRIAAWVLLFGMFAYFISGYGMTKSLITGDFAFCCAENRGLKY